jgi:hypothetical protein
MQCNYLQKINFAECVINYVQFDFFLLKHFSIEKTRSVQNRICLRKPSANYFRNDFFGEAAVQTAQPVNPKFSAGIF